MTNILDLPHSRARRLLSSGAPIYLSVNPVEYHGPHLSLHNDKLISEGLIVALQERLSEAHDWPLLTAGELEVGVDPTPGPGSRPVPFRLVRQLVEGACRALLELGAERVVIMTFHGGPLHTLALEPGVELLEGAGVAVSAPFNLLFQEALTGDGELLAEAIEGRPIDDELRDEMIRGATRDLHAGFLETSLTLHFAPDTVDLEVLRILPPCPELELDQHLVALAQGAGKLGLSEQLVAELELLAWAKAWTALDPFPGYTGSPHLATPEAGQVFTRIFLERGIDRIEANLTGGVPATPAAFQWLSALTLGGRVPLSPKERSEKAPEPLALLSGLTEALRSRV